VKEKEKKPKSNGQSKSNGKSPAKPRSSGIGARVAQTKTRGGKREQVEQTTSEKIKANQLRLHAQRQADGIKKWENGGKANQGDKDKVVKRYESYRREEQLPRQVEDRRVSPLNPLHAGPSLGDAMLTIRSTSMSNVNQSFCPFMAMPFPSIFRPSKTSQRRKRRNTWSCA
jgi:hypothetical protein